MNISLADLLAQRRKFLVAVAGLIGVALSTGLASGDVAHYLTVALSLLTAIGVHAVPNDTAGPLDLEPAPGVDLSDVKPADAHPQAQPKPHPMPGPTA